MFLSLFKEGLLTVAVPIPYGERCTVVFVSLNVSALTILEWQWGADYYAVTR